MPDAILDANDAGASSSPAPQTDANGTAGSSTTVQNLDTTVAKQSPSLQDVLGKAVGDVGTSTDPSTAALAATTAPQVGIPQTPEQIALAEAEKQKEDLPFHNHPRWKEVVAERDTFKAEVESYKVRTEAAEAVVNDLSGYLRETNMVREEFDQTLDAARKFKTGDMAGFLAQVLPLVQQAQMFTGDYFTPEIQAKLDAGLIDTESAKMLVQNQAQASFAKQQLDLQNQRTVEQQQQVQRQEQQQLLQRTETEFRTAHESWVLSNRATDPGFVNLERAVLAEAMLIRNANPAAITSPQVWTSTLEQAKQAVMARELALRGPAPRAITPITPSGNLAPNGAVATAQPVKSLRERLDQVVGGAVG